MTFGSVSTGGGGGGGQFSHPGDLPSFSTSRTANLGTAAGVAVARIQWWIVRHPQDQLSKGIGQPQGHIGGTPQLVMLQTIQASIDRYNIQMSAHLQMDFQLVVHLMKMHMAERDVAHQNSSYE